MAFQYKEIAKITVATLTVAPGVPVFFRVDGEPTKKASTNGDDSFYYAVPVTNLENGEEQQLNADEYTANALSGVENGPIGKCFKMVKVKVPGRRFMNTSLTQIEVTPSK